MFKFVSNISDVTRKLTYAASHSPAVAMSVLEGAAERIQERMNHRIDKSDYPVTWDSEKQRRAFFATDGFGHGIPYNRTGDTVWTISKPFQDAVSLFAPHPAGALFGFPDWDFWRSRIHRLTWPALRDVLFEEIEKIPAEILDNLKILFNGEPR